MKKLRYILLFAVLLSSCGMMAETITRDLITSADQLSSNASDRDEGQDFGALIDNDPETFWHSDWHSQVSDTHYLQVALTEPVEGDLYIYVQRRRIGTDHVTKLGVHGSNDAKNWTAIEDVELGNVDYGAEYTTPAISMRGASYRYLRFYILESDRGHIFGHFAEFHLTEVCERGDGEPNEWVDKFHELLEQAQQAYDEASGSVTKSVLTSADQLSSNASDIQEGQNIGALIDDNPNTFWHSDWHSQVSDTHYLQVALSEPIQDHLSIYVQRRNTANDHVTQLDIYGSNDEEEWTHVDNAILGNAYAGMEYTTPPISLKGGTYSYLRFYITGTTDSRGFGHFAEFHLNQLRIYGENKLLDLGTVGDELHALIEAGNAASDWKINENMYNTLKQKLDEFLAAIKELGEETGVLQSVDKIRQGSTYTIRGVDGRGYLVYNPEATTSWVSVLGVTKADELLGNELYKNEPDLAREKNVWQFIRYQDEWYLYNPEARKFVTSDGTTAYKLSATPAPVHVIAVGDGTFAINGVNDDSQSDLFACIDLTKEVKPLQRGVLSDEATHLIIEKAQIHPASVDVYARLQEMRLPQSLDQLTNLPTIYINTFDNQYIGSKTVYKYANLWRVDGDKVERYDSLEIRGRGNSTWGLAKKPYRIKFLDKEKFLGSERANAKSWTLMANHADKTLIRNAVASYIGTQLGQVFTPAASFVDLYLNDKYLGNYQVSDQVQIKKKRINIVEQEEPATADSDISGGYLLEIDGTAGGDPVNFGSVGGTPVSIKSPDETVINWDQRNYIQNFYNDFETRALSENYADPQNGYRAIVDSTSLASWFLTVEYCGNPDGFYSIYLYKNQADDHLYFGPIWDYDIAFNNCNRIGETTDKMMTYDGYRTGAVGRWLDNMWRDPWFQNLTGRVWHKAVREGLVENTINYIDSMAVVIDESQKKNFEIWPLDGHVYNEITLWSTYQEGVDYLKKFVVEHADYMNTIIPDPDSEIEDPTQQIEVLDSHYYTIYNIGTDCPTDVSDDLGVCIWEEDEQRKETQQWYLESAGNDNYRIISRGSNLAITDMASGSAGNYNPGSNLHLQEVDKSNKRQLWHFVPCADNWVIENVETHLAWNNSNGGSDNGNPVLSWKNDQDNAAKPTRQWNICVADERLGDSIASTEDDPDYRIVYNPDTHEIRVRVAFGGEVPAGTMALYNMGGQRLMTGALARPMNVGGLTSGVYILRWTCQGKQRAIKVRI